MTTDAKFSEKLTFLTPRYVHVRIRGSEMLVFRKILRTYLMNIIRMSTLPLTPFTRVSNLFLIELILIWAIIIWWRFDVRRDFSLFPKYSDSKFGFRIRGAVFEKLSVQTSLIFYVISLLLIFTKGLLISYHL